MNKYIGKTTLIFSNVEDPEIEVPFKVDDRNHSLMINVLNYTS